MSGRVIVNDRSPKRILKDTRAFAVFGEEHVVPRHDSFAVIPMPMLGNADAFGTEDFFLVLWWGSSGRIDLIVQSTQDSSIHKEVTMPEGLCPMCLENKPLISSHLASAALYKLCRAPDSDPVHVTAEVIMRTSKQLQDYLLCSGCDGSLSENGENWLLPLLARIDGTFPLYDILVKNKPDMVDGDSTLYAAAKNPEIKVEKIVHFAMGMFWKASVHPWSGKRIDTLIDLGKYREGVRKFLRGEGPFPERMALTVGISRPPVAPTFNMPYRGLAKEVHNFLFHVPGINFALSVGNQVTEELKRSCFASHPLHTILVMDLAVHNLGISKEVAAKARKAKSIIQYVKESKHLQEYLKKRETK